ncbi:MAG: hypothetical protein E2O86_05280 [Bacteroidetes bacterium]|nr:MAG: hypothetical protein E2O86_05280 [Bacteroidota bacterium]
MEDIQQSEFIFYLPLIAAYTGACLTSYFFFRRFKLILNEEVIRPKNANMELVLAVIAVAAIFAIGRIYDAGYLLSSKNNPLVWIINNLIIYSPILILIAIRGHSLSTVWISPQKWHIKIISGLLSSIIALVIFFVLRSEWYRWAEVLDKSLSLKSLSNFAAVFLEGVAIAFLFVRLKWASNLKVALFIPAILFAFAHVPGMLADNDPWWHILLMSSVTGAITILVLYTCNKLRDIIWIGLVHYFLDVAINSF